MRNESKRGVLFTATLVIGLFALSSLAGANVTIGAAQPAQSSATYSADQQVVARVTVRSQQEMESLIASDVSLLEGHKDQDVFILTTFAKFEQLQREGWAVTMLFVRGADADSPWRSVQSPLGGCSYSIAPTNRAVTAAGGSFFFNLTTSDPSCEWTILVDGAWIHVNGPGQGTGSTQFFYTVDANTASTNRVGHVFIADQVFTVYQGAQFNDVPQNHVFYVEIEKISARGITLGCGNNNFCPDGIVTRDQMAAFIVRALGEFNPPTPAMQRFADVPPSNPFYNFIDRLAELGITQGCSATNYCPADPVLREQSAALIIRALGEFNPPTPATQRFADVPPSNPFYNFIDRMAALGITQGCGGGNFCPKLAVSRAQMAAFIVRAFNL